MSYILATRCSAHAARTTDPLRRQDDAHDRLFRRFIGFSAPRVIRRPCQRLIPEMLLSLGYLRGLIYSSDREEPGCLQTYIHFMETPPILACDPQGTHLYIVGGRYRVTPRGIEG